MTVFREFTTVRKIKSVLMVITVTSSGVYLVIVFLKISKDLARVSSVFSSWAWAEGEEVETTIGKRRCLGGNTIEKTDETVAPKKNVAVTWGILTIERKTTVKKSITEGDYEKSRSKMQLTWAIYSFAVYPWVSLMKIPRWLALDCRIWNERCSARDTSTILARWSCPDHHRLEVMAYFPVEKKGQQDTVEWLNRLCSTLRMSLITKVSISTCASSTTLMRMDDDIMIWWETICHLLKERRGLTQRRSRHETKKQTSLVAGKWNWRQWTKK